MDLQRLKWTKNVRREDGEWAYWRYKADDLFRLAWKDDEANTSRPQKSDLILVNFLRTGVFDVQNIITIPHAKLLRKLEELTKEQLAEVEEVLLFWLGFKEEIAEDEE
ncbi:hypothetical protein LC593_14595 [Nostoc sp. CHAB 5844]|nr:hypothetical protein [Nostoc sp. CHAB 5844]